MRLLVTRCLISAAMVVLSVAPIKTWAQQELAGRALVDALRHGGYVIVMRHATTEAKPDSPSVDLASCATQRNLIVDGRTMARLIGTSVDAMQVPLGRVISSPFCRTRDTADLAFGHGETNPGLGEKAAKNPATSAEAAAALRPLIAAQVPAGTNTVVVTHGFNIKSVVGADFVEGEAAIFRPDGKGGFMLIARVLPQDWSKLANQR